MANAVIVQSEPAPSPSSLTKRFVAELVGTFLLTVAALLSPPQLTFGIVGATLLVLVVALGKVSGCHINPAVTFALATTKRFPWREVPTYWSALVVGVVLGLLVSLGGPALLDSNAAQEARGLTIQGRSTVREFGADGASLGSGLRVHVAAIAEPPQMVIFGAIDFASALAPLAKAAGLSTVVVYGGVGQGPQVTALKKGVDVVIACPGRLEDLMGQGHADLSAIEITVLDEADQMLDLGFIHALKKIVRMVPRKRQTLFFSATMPVSIRELANQFLHEPKTVSVVPASTTAERVDQYVTFVNQSEKQALLTVTLQDPTINRALVFTRTKHGADRVVKLLAGNGIAANAIHGNKSQGQRERALGEFKDGKTKVLVATDIAARGIDVSGVSHVINFELPNVAEQYVHRIGRTARAGASGIAITLAAPDDAEAIASIEKLMGIKIARTGGRPEAAAVADPVADEADASVEAKPERTRRARKPEPRAEAAPVAVTPPPPAPRRPEPAEPRVRRAPEPAPPRKPVAAAANDADEGWNGPVPSFLEMTIPS